MLKWFRKRIRKAQ